jgi:hypothetical protein
VFPAFKKNAPLASNRRKYWGMQDLGRFLVIIGGVVAILGLLMWTGFIPSWLGRLPGDIRIQRGGFSLYFPIVTCIVISVILTLIFSFFRR